MALSMSDLAKTTQDVYERNAARFDAERAKILFEKKWIDCFLGFVPEAGHVLDLGCGSGEPIAGYIIGKGYKLTGVDASAAMLRLAREKFPNGDWRKMDMRALDLPELFHGILGWNSFFHLTRDEQRAVLPKLMAHLAPSAGSKPPLTISGPSKAARIDATISPAAAASPPPWLLGRTTCR